MKDFTKQTIKSFGFVLGVLLVVAGASYLFAWSDPGYTTVGSPPPDDNSPPPINLGDTAKQVKVGDICTTAGGTEKCLSTAGGGGPGGILADRFVTWVGNSGIWDPDPAVWYAYPPSVYLTTVVSRPANGVRVIVSPGGFFYVRNGENINYEWRLSANTNYVLHYTLEFHSGQNTATALWVGYTYNNATIRTIGTLSPGSGSITFNTGVEGWGFIAIGGINQTTEFTITDVSIQGFPPTCPPNPIDPATSPANGCLTPEAYTFCGLTGAQGGSDRAAFSRVVQWPDGRWLVGGYNDTGDGGADVEVYCAK